MAAVAAAALVFAFVAAWAPLARADGPVTAEPSAPSTNPSSPDSGPTPQTPTDTGGSTGTTPDTGGTPVDLPPPTPPDTPPSDPGQGDTTTTPGDQSTPPVNDQTQDTTGAPTDSSGDSSTRKSSPTAAPAASSTPAGSQDSTNVTAAPVPPDAGGPADQMWVEQWNSFQTGGVVAKGPGPPGAQLMARGRFLLLGTGGRRAQLEGEARQSGQRPKVSALGGGLAALPGLPGRVLGSFLDLFSGGGGGATLIFVALLCVLGAMLLPIPSGARSFRLPAVSWRPSVYVPPLDQPG